MEKKSKPQTFLIKITNFYDKIMYYITPHSKLRSKNDKYAMSICIHDFKLIRLGTDVKSNKIATPLNQVAIAIQFLLFLYKTEFLLDLTLKATKCYWLSELYLKNNFPMTPQKLIDEKVERIKKSSTHRIRFRNVNVGQTHNSPNTTNKVIRRSRWPFFSNGTPCI